MGLLTCYGIVYLRGHTSAVPISTFQTNVSVPLYLRSDRVTSILGHLGTFPHQDSHRGQRLFPVAPLGQ